MIRCEANGEVSGKTIRNKRRRYLFGNEAQPPGVSGENNQWAGVSLLL